MQETKSLTPTIIFIKVLLNILSVLAIIVFGALVVVIVADLILCLVDDHDGIIFKRKQGDYGLIETVISNKE